MPINILVADDKERMISEEIELKERFGNNIYFARTVADVDRLLNEREYAVAIADPLELHTIPAFMEYFLVSERVRHVLFTIKNKGVPLIFAASEFTKEQLQLEQGKHYDVIHAKPYNVAQLVEQIELLTS